MRKPLAIAVLAAMMLAPVAGAAQSRQAVQVHRGDQRWRAAEAHADRNLQRAAAQENRSRPGEAAPRLPPGLQRAPAAPAPRALGRGQYLPPAARGAPIQDFGRYRLRTPPPGYDWVQVGRNIYLMQRSTGLVLEAIPGGY